MREQEQAAASQANTSPTPSTRKSPWPSAAILGTVLMAILVYQLDSFDPAPLPNHELTQPPLAAPLKNGRVLRGAEYVGAGNLNAPEDIAYDSRSGLIYTTCADGWIKRVSINDSVMEMAVENWVNTGGRPLGLVLGHHGEVIVADAYKGLLNISVDGSMELLTNQAEGLAFNFTDGVDIAGDGTIYFTDASYKYNFHEFIWDIFEGKPHGRLLSYDPITKQTTALARDLYFPNGVAVSPDEDFVVFCETSMRRCRRYYIRGIKKGKIEKFVDNLPGLPDNIHYSQGHYCIALPTEVTTYWGLTLKHAFFRKIMGIITRQVGTITMAKNGGVFVVDKDGKPAAHYCDPGLGLITSGVEIGAHLYCGSIVYPYIVRFNLTNHISTT